MESNDKQQLELYKERVRVLENIKGDNNYLNEYIEADRKARRLAQQAQSQFIRDQDIIRDLKQQHDKLDLALQAKNKDLENVVCKMGKSTETLLCHKNEQLHVFDSDDTLEDAENKLSAEQTYFPLSFISSEKVSSETKPSMASMPSANPMFVDLNEMENVFKKLFELLEKNCKRESIFYTSKEE
ncbi:hypothetical protein Tco_0633382, partial [Tanacetum coccineum]